MKQLKFIVLILCVGLSSSVMAQEDLETLAKTSQTFRADADVAINKDEFVSGEALYRKSISLEPQNTASKYNLGNAYYKKEKNKEAMRRFVQAAEVADTKSEKHKAFHNLGNTLMNAKMYKEAVEAYKNALRNNPTDDETRYNLALAKEMLEKEQQNNGGGDNNDDKDEKEKDKEDKEGEEGEEKDEQNQEQNKDQEQKPEQGDEEEKQGDPKKPDQPQEQEQQKPQPGQLSKQQIESLLEAMNNEEQKVQQKMNVKDKKGAKVKSNKDW
jgi:tetratricopeptide (TPR) repeat protein